MFFVVKYFTGWPKKTEIRVFSALLIVKKDVKLGFRVYFYFILEGVLTVRFCRLILPFDVKLCRIFENLSVTLSQGCNARKVNCGCVYSAYTLKPVLSGRNL